MSLLDKLNWRYATKKFDETKKVSQEQLKSLLNAVQLSPSSAGLQAYRIIIVSDPKIKAQLREASYGQQQLTTSSHVFVFAAETGLDGEYVKNYIDRIAEVRGVDRSTLELFENNIKNSVNSRTEEEKINWNKNRLTLH